MSIFNFLSAMFGPITETIDNLHTSEEEKGQIEVAKSKLQNQLAEIEAKVTSEMMKLQMKAIESQTKMEQAVQQHGNWFTKSVRPLTHLLSFIIIILMGMGYMQYSELIIKVCGGYLGVYAGLRTYEKKK